jgi:glycosyltransferase involved in cell wall biosynthesis
MLKLHNAEIVTIGLPTCNGASSIALALSSLLGQSLDKIKLVISDNASEDDTVEIIKRFKSIDSRIEYYVQPKRLSALENFRFTLMMAKSEYFMWAADDDFWLPNFICKNYENLIKNPKAICSQSYVIFKKD